MRLDFNVLWVDDQPDRVQAQIKAITERMVEHGFEFRPTLCKSLDEVQAFLASDEDVFTDEIDLILVDWDLGGETHGEAAIAAIREAIRYKDVVFYSAQNPAVTLRELAFKNGLEGVYCTSREGLVEEVLGVFESLVKKVLDLDHTRGIVMGATSDIDFMVNESLMAIHDKMDGDGKAALLKEAIEYVEKKIGELTEKAERLRVATGMADLFEAHLIFTANDRLRILSRVLKGETSTLNERARQAVVTYMEKVVPNRNIYGHLVLHPKGKPTGIAGYEGKTISLEEALVLRRTILDLRQEFRTMRDILKSA